MEEETKNPIAPPETSPEPTPEPETSAPEPEVSTPEPEIPIEPETPPEENIPEPEQSAVETPAPEPTPEPVPDTPEPTQPEPSPEPETPAPSPEPAPAEKPVDLVTRLETEEAAPAPISPLSTEPKKKSKAPLIILIVLLVLALGVVAVLFFAPEFITNLFGKTAPITSQETTEPELPEANELRLSGNSLSNFDLTFLKLENKPENKIYSPLSIKYALAMLKDGAAGETKTQIESLIGDYQPKAYLNSENRSLANALFVRDQSKDIVLDSYIETIKNKYYGEVIFDSFSTPDNLNAWVENKTLGLIYNLMDNNISDFDFILVNALGIDMSWNNKLQCASYGDGSTDGNIKTNVPCKYYSIHYAHEKYDHGIGYLDEYHNDPISFNGNETKNYAEIGVSVNRYDIVKDLGEDYIRETVLKAYEDDIKKTADQYYNGDVEEVKNQNEYKLDLDTYIEELSSSYGRFDDSTDFRFNVTDNEKIFAKELKEYDGSTLEYVGIMPKSGSLENYVTNLTAEKTQSLINTLKDPSDLENYTDGVITKISGKIPFYKFEYDMDLIEKLKLLGVTDAFGSQKADLTNLVEPKGEYISDAAHKANIDFSNEGIKAAAATWVGGMRAGGQWDYKWDVPVEEIDLTFDQPFLFLIRDKATGEIWFTGTVYEI